MRPFLISLFVLSALAIGPAQTQVQAQQRHYDDRACAGSCDAYGNPVREDGNLPPLHVDPEDAFLDEAQLSERRQYRSERRYRERRVRRRHVHRGHKRRVQRRHRHHRRHHNHRRRYAQPTFRNRTKFCSDHVERQRHGRKWVNVRRCVWVRNDLLDEYRDNY